MSYQSPIDLIMGQMNLSLEGEICKAVQNVGVYVDKEELLKALKYDRRQYQKGYKDRDSEIVRCRDCKYGEQSMDISEHFKLCLLTWKIHANRWFCADGERKET